MLCLTLCTQKSFKKSQFGRVYKIGIHTDLQPCFFKVKAQIARVTARTTKWLHIEHDWEYMSLGKLAEKDRTVHMLFTAHTPESNGLAER